VRVPFNHTLLEDDDKPGVYKPEGWKVLDSLLYWCDKHHVYVILDLHAAPGGQNAYFISDPDKGKKMWNDPANVSRTVALWKAIAVRYKSRRIIAGYDLLNEPGFDKKLLMPIYRQIISAIREADPHHMIILEGSALATDMSMFTSLPDANTILSFHMYNWFGDNRTKKLERHKKIARNLDVPLWVGEFGENKYEMLRSTVQMYSNIDYNVKGWCFWTWKKAPTSYPGLNVIQLTPSWKKLSLFLARGKKKHTPSRGEALKAMQEFLAASAYENVQKDALMLEALMAAPK
jgi:endoglucanase